MDGAPAEAGASLDHVQSARRSHKAVDKQRLAFVERDELVLHHPRGFAELLVTALRGLSVSLPGGGLLGGM